MLEAVVDRRNGGQHLHSSGPNSLAGWAPKLELQRLLLDLLLGLEARQLEDLGSVVKIYQQHFVPTLAVVQRN